MKKSRVMCLNNFGPSCRFPGLFLEFQKIKSSPKTGVSQITKHFNINPILTSHNYIQKIIGAWHVFVKLLYLHKQESYAALKIYCASDDITRLWRHYPIWRYLLESWFITIQFRKISSSELSSVPEIKICTTDRGITVLVFGPMINLK